MRYYTTRRPIWCEGRDASSRVEGMIQEQDEENPQKCWCKDAALFDGAVYLKWPRHASVILSCLLSVDAGSFNEALEIWWTCYLRHDPE